MRALSLFTDRVLDYEGCRFYNLTVVATNMVGANASAHVAVHVLDRNDNAPRFLRDRYRGLVSEAAEAGSVVLAAQGDAPLVVTAEDADSEANALLVFEIVEKWARKFFHVDTSTGEWAHIPRLEVFW